MSLPRTLVILMTGFLISPSVFASEPPRFSSAERGSKGCYAVRIESIGSTSTAASESESESEFAKLHRGKKRAPDRHRFSARGILDLRFRVLLREKDQSGLVEIDLYTPNGNLYETLEAEFDTEHSLGQARYRFQRARVVTASLPVAGSYITRRSLFGEWRAEVHLDGDESTCTHPTTFVLEP